MRFATIEFEGWQQPVVVSADGEGFCPVATLLPGFTGDLIDLIVRMPKPDLPPVDAWTPLAAHALMAPIPQPRRNVFCVGKNYHEHAKEFAQSGYDTSAAQGELGPSFPVIFTKNAFYRDRTLCPRIGLRASDRATGLRGRVGLDHRHSRQGHQQDGRT